jgi:hypothetical protein
MASGHVNRTNRPNTWLHRPATRREDSPCQLGAVHTWHFASNEPCAQDVRFLGIGGLAVDAKSTRMTQSGNSPQRFVLTCSEWSTTHRIYWLFISVQRLQPT